jgi:hypothetical protein
VPVRSVHLLRQRPRTSIRGSGGSQQPRGWSAETVSGLLRVVARGKNDARRQEQAGADVVGTRARDCPGLASLDRGAPRAAAGGRGRHAVGDRHAETATAWAPEPDRTGPPRRACHWGDASGGCRDGQGARGERWCGRNVRRAGHSGRVGDVCSTPAPPRARGAGPSADGAITSVRTSRPGTGSVGSPWPYHPLSARRDWHCPAQPRSVWRVPAPRCLPGLLCPRPQRVDDFAGRESRGRDTPGPCTNKSAQDRP